MPLIEISHQATMRPTLFIVLFYVEHISSHDNGAGDGQLQLHSDGPFCMTRTTVQSDTTPDFESVSIEGFPVQALQLQIFWEI